MTWTRVIGPGIAAALVVVGVTWTVNNLESFTPGLVTTGVLVALGLCLTPSRAMRPTGLALAVGAVVGMALAWIAALVLVVFIIGDA